MIKSGVSADPLNKEELSKARYLTYIFLSRAFSYPDSELLEVKWGDIFSLLKEARLLKEDDLEDLDVIAEILDSPRGISEILEELQVEYTRLFVNSYPKTPLPPYESVQLGEGQVWGDSTEDAVVFYKKCGLAFSRGKNDLPDHVAAEFEFMAFLIQQALTATGENERQDLQGKQREFLQSHLLRWVPEFLRKVDGESRSVFYRHLAQLGQRFLLVEKEMGEIEGGGWCA